MPLMNYGVLKGRPIALQLGSGVYHIHVVDDTMDYRLLFSVSSQPAQSELEFLIDPSFQHAFLPQLEALPTGWHQLPSGRPGPALDFIRSKLFKPSRFVPVSGSGDSELRGQINQHLKQAIADEDAMVYAFGERWGPESGRKDKMFGFVPGNGMHNIHMNQGNEGRWRAEDGVYQDGALLLHFPRQQHWVAIFLKFGSQAWHTDPATGHRTSREVKDPASANDHAAQPSKAPEGATSAAASNASPALQEESAEVDALVVAWRLVVDLKAKPDLLLHLEPGVFADAVLGVVGKSVAADSPWPVVVRMASEALAQRQPSLEPSALWLAWMRVVHAAKVAALSNPVRAPIS